MLRCLGSYSNLRRSRQGARTIRKRRTDTTRFTTMRFFRRKAKTTMKHDTRIPSSTKGLDLHVHYRMVDEKGRRPTILLSHGFTVDGTESHRMFLSLADQYNQ